ncbi:MAG: DUF1858 domain-containing protein [Brevinematales bacterium]|nr:DUF1858 domain-containing protein [Brevinematales bacterium]
MNELIKETDKIYDIVTKYPQIKEKLLSISNKFQKLNNPLIFNTVAKVTTVRKASEVAGIYINEFLYELNDAIGLGKEFLEFKKKDIFSKKEAFLKTEGDVKPVWADDLKDFIVKDVREIGEPFFEVVEFAKTHKYFCIVQNFKPIPLITYLESLGFESYTEFKDNAYYIYFYKKTA